MRALLSREVIFRRAEGVPDGGKRSTARRSWGTAMDVNFLINNFRSVVTEHYFDFNGRARRQVFWYYCLVYFVIAVVVGIIGNLIGTSILSNLLSLALLLPSLGLNVRRLHDVNQSGWWVLIAFTVIGVLLLLYWAIQPGTTGANQYGADPKAGSAPGGATAAA
jgi:uncharacterized membrane protein YhaH (DUF805 family)